MYNLNDINNLKEEEARVAEQLASDRAKYKVALDTKRRLEDAKVIHAWSVDDAIRYLSMVKNI